MRFEKQAMEANTSFLLIIFLVVQYIAWAQNLTISHFTVEEASFERLCQSKKILTINGLFPGPTLYARAGETLILDVENKGKDNITMFCCRRNGRFDKMIWLIEPGSKVRKTITIFDDVEGTLWWHAMNIWQSATVHGAFLIHPKPGTAGGFPFSKPYGDIPIILGEWWKKDVKEVFLEYIPSASRIMNSDAFTVNGQPGDFYPCSNNGTFKIQVHTGNTYLLRIVNAAIGKTFYFGIAKHNLTVMAIDGSRITKPFTTDYVKLTAQQTIDCIFEANQQPDYYYIAATAYVGQTYDTNKTTTAIVQYQGNYTPSSPPFLPNNFNYQYNKSSSRKYLYVILTFVILGLFFSIAIGAIFSLLGTGGLIGLLEVQWSLPCKLYY